MCMANQSRWLQVNQQPFRDSQSFVKPGSNRGSQTVPILVHDDAKQLDFFSIISIDNLLLTPNIYHLHEKYNINKHRHDTIHRILVIGTKKRHQPC